MIEPASWGGTPPVLTTARLVLRGIGDGDVAALFALFSDPETMRYWSSAPHESPARTAAMVADIRARFAAGDGIEWAITRPGDDTAVGKIGHWRWSRVHRRSEVGFILRRDLWRQGYAAEALAAVVRFGFDVVGLHSIEAQLDAGNVGSLRTLERVGFVREGCTRQSYFDGQRFSDTALYGLLASDLRGR